MTRNDVRARVLDILTSKERMSLQIDVSNLTDSTSLLKDVGMDSIQILEFIVSIEEAFGVVIDSELNLSLFDRFANLLEFIEQHMNATSSR